MPEKPENFCKIAVKGGECAVGRIVRSNAGRDRGKLFLIVGVEDENHLLLADGRLRPLERPKKKKLRHVSVLPGGSDSLRETLLEGGSALNAELRRIISEYGDAESDAVSPDRTGEAADRI